MELTASNPRTTPEAKRKMAILLAGLWGGALVVFITTSWQNWGAFAGAAVVTAILWLFRPEDEYTFKITLGGDGLSITHGPNFMWGASVDELAGVEVIEESKKWGVVLSPRRLVFHKQGGDLYSIGTEFFDQGALRALVEQIQHELSFRSDASR
ncbi:MAG TPA: hypothetical protein ENN42_11055 [Thioalkalivibrio sp.]|nr:hypothetical protein [Thioalkalivibrio sp.]